MILATHGIVGSQIQSFVGLLDTYPNAAAAYSVRKLRAAYTGSAIRVRRTSDNTESNIGFTATGNLNTTALTSFCGAGNGFVTTWYDQSGNGNNATQTTAASQPQIVNSGSILLQNGKPRIQPFQTPGMDTGIKANATLTFFGVSNVVNSPGPYRILSSYAGSGSLNNEFLVDVYSGTLRLFGLSQNISKSITTLYNLSVAQLISGTSISIANNGSTFSTTAASSTSASTNNLFIGEDAGGSSSEVIQGLQEIIIYNSDQTSNRTGIETNINTYYGIY